ncbi:MAG: DUF262 domain-containing protein [Candidatus Cloacimonetes bacterium]|uniref:GmrSD restriction endonuclease domain-containing protein n=1 Tax=Clostridium sp. C105KSO13 TaxID=1776045 RepID=UPI0007407053|nr:DUF262 domain-containing protein [Clostridium sp. C105KSO13]MCK9335384.1 DUF262 domain-containing protein [Candidatus Cloacimonadota bacterium]CUX40113.1 hypothetical protein BN3456_02038 [Clostridium sp. C105KSO13]
MAQFDVYSTSVQNIISWIKSGEIAIPEIQRPFVWDSSKVRDLLDSLYKGFPIGYIIVWKNPDVRLKDGTISIGKKILIDGQQRVTALQAAIAGMLVTDANYKRKPIRIAFNPLTEAFEVLNPAIEKDCKWIPDISKVFEPTFEEFQFIIQYCKDNDLAGQEGAISKVISKLKKVLDISLGVTDLNQGLSIDEVTDIFIRINSQGVVLSQADFAMSKISADDKYGGNEIRKMIDYFCHFMQRPADYEMIAENDTDFSKTDAMQKIKWVVKETEDIYVPSYTDVLRVSFTHKFKRGKISDLVSLLSGRDFETRENLETIAEASFATLRQGVEAFVNQTNFQRYIMIVKSAGIIDASLVRSQNVLNFGYILYLTLKDQKMDAGLIEKLVRKWLVLSMLTGRYSGSAESAIDYDIKRFTEQDPVQFIKNTEAGELSDAFWNSVLVTRLDTSVASSPYFLVFLMAQVKAGSRGFLSEQIDVKALIEQRGDIHHIFPKKYLQKNGVNNRKDYNQIANYVYTQSEINIKIKDDAPCEYMKLMKQQIAGGDLSYGGITGEDDLKRNLAENCVPEEFMDMDIWGYPEFLEKRRFLMAQFVKKYYEALD